MANLLNTLYVKMLTAKELDLERKRQSMADEQDRKDKTERFALDVSRHVEDTKQKEFWRQSQLASREGRAAGTLGEESPAGAYLDPAVAEEADIAHMEGRVSRGAAESKAERDAYARKVMDLEFRQRQLEEQTGLKNRQLQDNMDYRTLYLDILQQRADAATAVAGRPPRAPASPREPPIPPTLKALFDAANSDARGASSDFTATPEAKAAASARREAVASEIVAVRLGLKSELEAARSLTEKFPELQAVLAGTGTVAPVSQSGGETPEQRAERLSGALK